MEKAIRLEIATQNNTEITTMKYLEKVIDFTLFLVFALILIILWPLIKIMK